jgi:sugar/nucleoside kinase (ribokinase family)
VTGAAGPGPGETPDRLLHLGSVVIDLVLNVPALPERGSDVLADSSRATPGGGFNVMAAAARQGLPVAYAGAHGSGPFAALARSGLAAEGIDLLLPPTAGLDTGVVIAIVDGGGERTFVTGSGAEACLTAADLAVVTARRRDVVYLSGYSFLRPASRSALLGWLEHLDDANLVIFDPGPLAGQIPAAALTSVLRRADWVTCNAREAAILTGEPEPFAAARVLASQRAPGAGEAVRARRGGVLVRTGSDGCLLVRYDVVGYDLARSAAAPVRVPGFRVAATDTNGAGDTHTGTFIAALASGGDEVEAVRLANAAAAFSVTRPGPAAAPTVAELTRFLADQP